MTRYNGSGDGEVLGLQREALPLSSGTGALSKELPGNTVRSFFRKGNHISLLNTFS